MPCFVTGTAEGDSRLEAGEARKQATNATDMLCRLLRQIESGPDYPTIPPDIIEWWEDHKELDRKSNP